MKLKSILSEMNTNTIVKLQVNKYGRFKDMVYNTKTKKFMIGQKAVTNVLDICEALHSIDGQQSLFEDKSTTQAVGVVKLGDSYISYIYSLEDNGQDEYKIWNNERAATRQAQDDIKYYKKYDDGEY